jgi:hypothetical protein
MNSGGEPRDPPVDGDVIDRDAAFSEQFPHAAAGQAVAQVPADREGDHLPREAEASEHTRRGRRCHWISLPAPAIDQRNSADGIVAMLTEDAWLTMPPLPLEYQGRDLAAQFLEATAFRAGWIARLLPARANGRPPSASTPATRIPAASTRLG